MTAGKATRVLVVDDSPQLLDVVAYNLRTAEFDVTTATDGHEAIGILKTNAVFDVVISDIHMPNIDGYGLCAFVMTLDPKPYFFMMTADNDVNEWDVIDKGASGLFRKPFDGSRLTVKLAILQTAARR